MFLLFNIKKIVIFRNYLNNIHLTSSDWKKINYSSLESSWWAASNGDIFISLDSMDEKLFVFYCLEIFINNFSFIEYRDINLPPFDAAR